MQSLRRSGRVTKEPERLTYAATQQKKTIKFEKGARQITGCPTLTRAMPGMRELCRDIKKYDTPGASAAEGSPAGALAFALVKVVLLVVIVGTLGLGVVASLVLKKEVEAEDEAEARASQPPAAPTE